MGKDALIEALEACAKRIVEKKLSRPSAAESNLLFLVDHCFQIKGKGTVATGKHFFVHRLIVKELSLEAPSKSIKMFIFLTKQHLRR